MTKKENKELQIKWNKLENDIIEEVSKLDNEKLMNMFLDWMKEKTQAKNLQQPVVIKTFCECEEKPKDKIGYGGLCKYCGLKVE